MSTPRRGLLAAGNWIVDFTKIIDVYPAQDALANILDEHQGNGGSPYNILADLSRLGAPFPLEAIGLVGDDDAGRWIRQDCVNHGVDATQLHVTSKAPTSYTNVMSVRSTGRRTFFHQRGANALLGPEHFNFSRSSAKFFHLGYLLLLDRLDQPHPEDGTVAARLLREAQELGFKTSIDVVSEDSDRFPAIVQPALRHVDYAIMNEFEAERSTGLRIRNERGLDEASLIAAARKFFDAGVREWVVIHFPEGALAASRNGQVQAQGSVRLSQDRIAGATGAGDAFCAGLLYGLHQDQAMQECLRSAVCSAAACMLDATSSGGLLPLQQCLDLGHQFEFRDPRESYLPRSSS